MKPFIFFTLFILTSCSTYDKNFRITSSEENLNEANCSEDTSKISGVDSPNYNYFRDLLEKGKKAPLNDFLKFWYPAKVDFNENLTYFFKCQMRPWSPLIYMDGYDEKGQLTPECSPDVLYSWGSKTKLDSMKNGLKNEEAWSGSANPGRTTLYTALTPFTTYGYGTSQIRLKIKPQIKFQTRDCVDTADKVCVRTATFQEFNLDDATVIESWSYGTPEQYDEIVRDIIRISSGKRAQGYYSSEPKGKGFKRLFGNLADTTEDSERKLKENLLELIRMIVSEEGQIRFYSGSCQNRKLHFSTGKPTYFNPN